MENRWIILTVVLFGLVFSMCGDDDSGNDGTDTGTETDTGSDTSDSTLYDIARVSTMYGDIYFWMYEETPLHKAMFIDLAEKEYYDQWTFNRVIANFVNQGGCPDEPEYFEDSPYLIEPEFVDGITHIHGAVGMGRDDNPEMLSNGCQFYVVNANGGLAFLNNAYTVFGIVIGGLDVVDTIELVKTDADDAPVDSIDLTVTIEQRTAAELLDEFGYEVE